MNRIAYTKKDFEWVNWTADEIRRQAEEAVVIKREAYERIKRLSAAELTFENTVYALDAADAFVGDVLSRLEFLMCVSTDAAVRAAAQDGMSFAEKVLVDVERDPGVYAQITAYAQKHESLPAPEQKLLAETLRFFRRMGFDLSAGDQKKYADNAKRISEMASEFQKNVNEYQDDMVVTLTELDGLPATYISGLRAHADGAYLVGLSNPEYVPFMQYATDATKRRELFEKYTREGGCRNVEILDELVRLREENARLLGYAHHADFVAEIRMTKKALVAQEFLNNLVTRVRPKALEELDELTVLKREMTGDVSATIELWDIAFYSNILRERKFSLDSQKLREYFPFEVVREAVFSIYSTLFGITFQKLDSSYPTWHESVELYSVHNANGELLSYCGFDMYPREGKYNHAAVVSVSRGRIHSYRGSHYHAPFSVMLMNVARPQKDVPSLLSHREVETFFHEFGHLVHGCLTTASYAAHAGTHVSRDFVEALSQMLEGWVWDSQILKVLSGHYQDSEKKLPDEMIKNLIASRRHMDSYASLRQFLLGLLDLDLYTKGLSNASCVDVYAQLHLQLFQRSPLPTSLFPASFTHIAGGYDAGYYGYMWSKVYAADMFTRFAKEGLLNAQTGLTYRRELLEVGSSRDELESVRKFLGREPNNEAFLKELGIH